MVTTPAQATASAAANSRVACSFFGLLPKEEWFNLTVDVRAARHPNVALKPRVGAAKHCTPNLLLRLSAIRRRRHGAFVLERHGNPYIGLFEICLHFRAVTGVTSCRSAPVTQIPSQDQPCNGCNGCNGEKWISSPSSLPDLKQRSSRPDAVRKEKAAQEKEGGERRAKGQARERERPAEP
jgi:hypothetical protein